MRAPSFSSGSQNAPAQWRFSPPPPDIEQPVQVVSGAAGVASARAAGSDQDGENPWRMSVPPQDTVQPVQVVAQAAVMSVGEWRFSAPPPDIEQPVQVATSTAASVRPVPAGRTARGLNDPGEITPDYAQTRSTGTAIGMFFDWLRRQLKFRVGVHDTSFFPHSAITKLRLLDGSGTLIGEGSGFYVGRNKVVTAGHCLVNDDGSRVQGVEVIPGLHGNKAPFGGSSVGLSGLRPHSRYNPLAYDSSFDIGVIVGAPDAPRGEFFEMEELRMSPHTGIITCGYASVGVDPTLQHLDVDTIRELHNGTFTYAAQVRQGSSGGPVFYAMDASTVRAVGLNVTAYNDHQNRGLRLTDAMISWINSL